MIDRGLMNAAVERMEQTDAITLSRCPLEII